MNAPTDFPNIYFKTDNIVRDELTRKLSLKTDLNVYIYGSTNDHLVTNEHNIPLDIVKCKDCVVIDNRNNHWTSMKDDKLIELVLSWILQ